MDPEHRLFASVASRAAARLSAWLLLGFGAATPAFAAAGLRWVTEFCPIAGGTATRPRAARTQAQPWAGNEPC